MALLLQRVELGRQPLPLTILGLLKLEPPPHEPQPLLLLALVRDQSGRMRRRRLQVRPCGRGLLGPLPCRVERRLLPELEGLREEPLREPLHHPAPDLAQPPLSKNTHPPRLQGPDQQRMP